MQFHTISLFLKKISANEQLVSCKLQVVSRMLASWLVVLSLSDLSILSNKLQSP